MAPQALCADTCVSGKERNRVRHTKAWHYTDSGGNQRTCRVTQYRRVEQRIVHVPINLGLMSAGVWVGAWYRFPFRVQLPVELPESLHVQEN